MTLASIVTPEAEADLSNAYSWYERRVDGLGLDFIEEFEALLQRIGERPDLYQVVHRDIRRALLRRFPYAAFYVQEPGAAVIIAVLHQAQHPRRALSRRR